jgi:hypothetical protein
LAPGDGQQLRFLERDVPLVGLGERARDRRGEAPFAALRDLEQPMAHLGPEALQLAVVGAKLGEEGEDGVQLQRGHVVHDRGEEVFLLVAVVVRAGRVEVADHAFRGDPRVRIGARALQVCRDALDRGAGAENALVATVEDVDRMVEARGRGGEEGAHGEILLSHMGPGLRRIKSRRRRRPRGGA